MYFTKCSQSSILPSLIFLVSFFFLIFFPNGTDSCARKSVFGKRNSLPALPSSKRPHLYNGLFSLFEAAVIERLDCTSVITRMLCGPFCKRGYHFTAKLHQIKTRIPAQINRFRFPSNSCMIFSDINS